MEREMLERYLNEGLSLIQIGVLENRDPSTVGYWVKRHGMTANGAERYAPRGGINRAQLEALVEEGLTIQQICDRLGFSGSTVNHWLRKYELKTKRAGRRKELALRAIANGKKKFVHECRRHGETEFLVFGGGRSRCGKCSAEAVQVRRLKVKRTLIDEAGGCCRLCGYDRYQGALQFHHLDPSEKAFGLGSRGVTRSLDKARAEASKCVLLCATCHAEVEGGFSTVS